MVDREAQAGQPEGASNPADAASIGQSIGCTLANYAQAKRLPADFLSGLGLTDFPHMGPPAVRIPYRAPDGSETAVRFRVALVRSAGVDRFRWRKGSKAQLYGLDRLDTSQSQVVIVEGESDAHTLWFHGFNAVAVSGAATWKEDRDSPQLQSFETVYVVVEPDTGGEAMLKWIARSQLRDRIRLVRLDGFKDPSELHIADPASFRTRWAAALDAAQLWSQHDEREAVGRRNDAWAACQSLAESPNILDRFTADVRRAGLVGEVRAAKLIYLALTSRFLERPVSIAVKGPSSGGKSFLCDTVLSFVPSDACHVLTAMSDRALAFGDEPLSHRFLMIYEASGMESDMASYLMRSLLSEGRIRYEFVEKTANGMHARTIEREGPTGLLVTTTKTSLHPENETRLFSLTVTDTPDQTRAIMRAMAGDRRPATLDFAGWHSLQEWLALAEHRVAIPYGEALAEAIPPIATRLRRDFGAILGLIKAHAILHQATRTRDPAGSIVATIDDYATVRELVADLIAEGAAATVSPSTRETVGAVAALAASNSCVTKKAVSQRLGIDVAAAWRRCQGAIAAG